MINHDAGTNFTATEIRQKAALMSITIKEVPVEFHHSFAIIEQYHAPLLRAYIITRDELKNKVSNKSEVPKMAIRR